jgi:DNA-directed RNA polymerase subunit RPC12/RpoP
MENKYTCSNCRKEVEFIAEDQALCETCRTNLPTAKYNSRTK